MALLKGRQLARGLAFAGVAAAGYAFGLTTDRADAQQPGLPGTPSLPPGAGAQPPKAAPAPAEGDRRVAAYIYGTVPVTREELGEFLIARGGYEKLELLVNRKIIEVEAQRRNVTVTPTEVKAALEDTVRGMGVSVADFEKHLLPRYGKTLYEYTEDMVRPRLLLTKMCQDRVKVPDEEIAKAFENRFGDRRAAKIITWNENDFRAAQKQWDEARKGDTPEKRDANFDRIARQQADPNLAASGGQVKPIGKYPETENDEVHKVLWTLQPGELSAIFKVPAGFMCVKYVGPVPPEENTKLDDKMKAALRKELFDQRLDREIPKFFTELKAVAKPQLYLKGPPSAAEFREGVEQLIQQAGGVPTLPPGPAQPAPLPKP